MISKEKVIANLEKMLNQYLSTIKKQYDKKYEVSVDESKYTSVPKLERLKTKEIDLEEIKKQAENELYNTQEAKKQSIIEKLEGSLSNLRKNSQNLKGSEEEEIQKIEAQYKNLIDGIENNNLKRGLQRSSIASEQVKNALTDMTEYKLEFLNNLDTKLKEIDGQIEQLEMSKEISLIKHDEDSALAIDKRISELKSEQEKLNNEALKYNNEITVKESNLKSERNKQINADLAKQKEKVDKIISEEKAYEDEYGDYNGDKKDSYTARYEKAYSFYSNLDKETTKQLIKNNESFLKDNLGLYYNRLIKNLGL